MSLRTVHLPDQPEDAHRLDPVWSVAVDRHLQRLEHVLAWLSNPAHPVHRVLLARRERLGTTAARDEELRWLLSDDRTFAAFSEDPATGAEVILRRWAQADHGISA